MIGLLVVSHGQLSKSLLETANMFASNSKGVEYVCFTEGQGIEDLRESVRVKLVAMDDFESVLLLVDIPGGSPARVAGEFLIQKPKIDVLTGVNLPLLVEAIVSRDNMSREKLIGHLIQVSRESIFSMGSMIRS